MKSEEEVRAEWVIGMIASTTLTKATNDGIEGAEEQVSVMTGFTLALEWVLESKSKQVDDLIMAVDKLAGVKKRD